MTYLLDTSTLAGLVRAACLLEAAARKPGNVHPAARFDDLCFEDFVRSAEVVAPILARTRETGLCEAILEGVRETRAAVGSNTNLGILLLLAPMCAVPFGAPLTSKAIQEVLERLTVQDTAILYEAIRQAHPGGLGKTSEQDLASSPSQTPVQVMGLARDRDQIARQWSDGYLDVLNWGQHALQKWTLRSRDWERTIVGLQLDWLATYGDSLICRKLGDQASLEVQKRGSEVLTSGWPDTSQGWIRLKEFDDWLRGDGHRRNPGTTADIIAAVLFAAIRDGRWNPPSEIMPGDASWRPEGSEFE